MANLGMAQPKLDHPCPEWLAKGAQEAQWLLTELSDLAAGTDAGRALLERADAVIVDAPTKAETPAGETSQLIKLCYQLREQLRTLGVPVIAVLHETDDALELQALRGGAADCLVPTQSDEERLARVATLRRLGRLERSLREHTERLEMQQRALEQSQRALEQKVIERTRENVRGRDAIIFGLAKLAESRDENTGQHLERVCAYSAVLAGGLLASDAALADKLGPGWVAIVEQTSALHDIGKVGVPDGILLKAGPLTTEERTIMQRHTTLGGDTLNAIRLTWGDNPYIVTAMQITMAHHEQWNGKGYPYGLAGETIPLAARIVAVADVYDALTSERPYKRAFSHEKACAMIAADSGTHFDPSVIAVFTRSSELLDSLRQQYQDVASAS